MPSHSRQSADNLVQLLDSMSLASAQQAVVSPCSQCKNRRAVPEEGKPACPRAYWKQWTEQARKLDPGVADVSYNLLTLTGSDNDALVNPVYDASDHHILVWVAHLRDNRTTYDQDGKVLTPQLLDPAFDTDYIQCALYPYVVRDTEAGYFQRGSYREWDQLETVGIPGQTLVGDESQSARVSGFAHKVNFAYSFNRQKVDKDLCARGT